MSYFPISAFDEIGEARREGLDMARRLGFSEEDAGKVALAVTEAGTNLVKHAGGGGIFLSSAAGGQVEVLAVDRGPGIADVKECLRDGHSTSGSPGTGLGMLARMSADFDLYTAPGAGTAVLARLSSSQDGGASSTHALEVGGVCSPIAGEEVSGDAWALRRGPESTAIFVADGLGHGPAAAEASREAVRVFLERPLKGTTLMDAVHRGLLKTRGAVAAIAEVDLKRKEVRFCGVGNIAGMIIDGETIRRMTSANGTAGHQIRNLQEFTYPWPADGLLLLHSDGVASALSLGLYPGLPARHPSLIAAVLHRDFARKTDDATVVVARRARR